MLSRDNNNFMALALIGAVVLVSIFFVRGCLLQKKKPAEKGRIVASHEIKRPGKGVTKSTPVAKAPSEAVAHMAIVLDDWGYNQSHCRYLQEIATPLGVAILPGLPYSKAVIACAREAGKEPMLHLPLEPYSSREYYSADYLLTVAMPVTTLQKMLKSILNDMPGVVGVNNHTGSRGTESLTVMTTVLGEIKKRNLFFVDSMTSDRSVCAQAADSLKMRIARRDVFLDNRNERAYIERQFAMAVRMAKRRGYALVIGHDRELTLKIIKEQTDKLSKQGVEFLPVKEYIRQYEYPRN